MKSILKYLIILPLVLFNYSCDDGATESNIYNGDVIGSWMLTGLTGTYTYVIDLPGEESGVAWPADTSFGVRIKWNYADAVLGDNAEKAQFWVPGAEFSAGDVSLYTVATYDLATMAAAGFGLIGVFEDAPSAGADATYKMKGEYPGVFYNYSLCSSAGSTAPMTDQGVYTWNQTLTTDNFVIKRDPSIAGSQVLPPFDDGTLTVSDTSLNIKFLDRDSHSTLYADIMDAWDEGTHPDAAYGGTGTSSGGDRSYMAFPPLVVDENGAFAGSFTGAAGTTPATSGYYMSADLANWGGYMTWYAFSFMGESAYLGGMAAAGAITIADADADGAITSVDIAVYMMSNPTNTTQTGMPYSVIVSQGTDGMPVFANDSAGDINVTADPATLGPGGKMTFNVISDCAAPVDVTIDFDVTFTRCTTDNCVGDNYHVTPTW